MNEQELRDQLTAAVTDHPHEPAPVGADLARGRRALRRHRAMVAGGAFSGVALLSGAAVLTGHALHGTDASGQARLGVTHGGWSPRPHHQRSPHVPSTVPPLTISAQHVKVTHRPGALPNYPHSAWLSDVYELTRQHLDPDHRYTSYDDNEQGSSEGGHIALGTRVTWQQQADTGMGDVSVEVRSPGSRTEPWDCEPYGGCTSRHDPLYGDYLLGGTPDGPDGFIVIVTQQDGELAVVSANPLYGNNSLTPTVAPLPSVDQVLGLATDPALDLPAS